MSEEIKAPMLSQKSMERNVIACILTYPTTLHDCDISSPASFETPALRAAFTMIMELRDAGHEEVTTSTLRHFYDSRPDFQKVVAEHGGWKFVETLALTPDIVNFKLHMEELKVRNGIRATRARLVNVLDTVTAGEYKSEDELLAVLDTALASSITRSAHQVIEPGAFSREWLKEQAKRFQRGEFEHGGIAVDFPLDRVCGTRWANGSMNIWAGETNVGKSMIVSMLVGDYCTTKGVPTLVLDNEMMNEEFMNRYLARASGIETYLFDDGRAYNENGKDWEKLCLSIDEIKDAPFTWIKLEELKISTIEPIIRRFLRKYPTAEYPNKQVIIDGLKLDSAQDAFWSVGFLAQALKMMVGRYAHEGLVLHCTTQLNRAAAKESRGKGDVQPSHLDVGLSKLVADNCTDFYILCHDFQVDSEGEKIFNTAGRRLICTKARSHSVLDGKSYLFMDFAGECASLRPKRAVNGNDTHGALDTGTDSKADIKGI